MLNFFIKATLVFYIVYQATSFAEAAHENPSLDKVKKSIVTITSIVHTSAMGDVGRWFGTGFIVDKKKGLLVTNHHVVGIGCIGNYLVTFHNGQQSKARSIYYDLYADFAIMAINPDELPEDIEEISFTKQSPRMSDKVFVISNAEGQAFSHHEGRVADLYNVDGELPQGSYTINLNTAGGASGSPILNQDNEAIGILYGSAQTFVLALKSEYITNALEAIYQDKTPQRRHIGAIISLYSLDNAVRHRSFPKALVQKYLKEFPYARNRALAVRSILPGSPAENILMPGDILWKVNGKMIGADATFFDLEIAKSEEVDLTIIRAGQELQYKIKSYDSEDHKIKRILEFAGGLFFEADDVSAFYSGAPLKSVALASVQTGSSFSAIPSQQAQNRVSYRVHIKNLNGIKIHSLDDMIKAIPDLLEAENIYLEYINCDPYYPDYNARHGYISWHESLMQDVSLDNSDKKPRLFIYDEESKLWEVQELKQD